MVAGKPNYGNYGYAGPVNNGPSNGVSRGPQPLPGGQDTNSAAMKALADFEKQMSAQGSMKASGGGKIAPAPVSPGPTIGAPPAPSLPVDVAVPEEPNAPSAMPPDLAGGQMLSGPTQGRSGLGQRIPPSLASLLKNKVY